MLVAVERVSRTWYDEAGFLSIVQDAGSIAPEDGFPFVIVQMYEPLVRVACDGSVVPALAERWSSDPAGALWQFTLREGARLGYDEPLTADGVAAGWRMRHRPLRTWDYTVDSVPPLSSVTVDGSHSITAVPLDPQRSGSRVFGHLSLVVGGLHDPPAWPAATGRYTVYARDGAWMTSWHSAPMFAVDRDAIPQVLRIEAHPQSVHRDLLDAGVDVLQTRDPVAIDYARRAALTVVPLPWDRTYVLALPARSVPGAPLPQGGIDRGGEATWLRDAFAREAVPTDARVADGERWWEVSPPCYQFARDAKAAPPLTGDSAIVSYDPEDPIARALAERIAAIASSGGRSRDAAALAQLAPELRSRDEPYRAVAGTALMRAVGGVAAYVMAIPYRTTAPCVEVRRMKRHGLWISPPTLVPLIDSRSSLIVRPGAPAISVDWDGNLLIHPARQGVPPPSQ